METLALLAGIVIGAVAAWYLGLERAAAEMKRLRSDLEGQISYWQDRSRRATAQTARLAEQTSAWIAGCQQGREDMLSLTWALSNRPQPPGDNLESA